MFILDRSFCACSFLLALLFFVDDVHSKECDRFSECRGPIRFYEDLNCKPIYDNPGDCCAPRYDCSHLSGRSLEKCYGNGREYEIGEKLRDEDRTQPCNTDCRCEKLTNGESGFACGVAYCSYGELEGCYVDYSAKKCCGTKVCGGSEGAFHCKVDGKLYKIGQEFYPERNPDLVCLCLDGYKGKNVAPFCRKSRCGTEMYDSARVLSGCVPVFPADLEPSSTCRWFTYRCQNENDTVIGAVTSGESGTLELKEQDRGSVEGATCKFGNLTMRVGDRLNQDTDLTSICVECVCEVPPTPTCQRLPASQCDGEKYNRIYNFIKKYRPDRHYF